MIDFWTVFGALATILVLVGSAYRVGVARGGAKTKRDLCDERRQNQFSRIYAPAYALFLTRHITTASGRGAPYFRQRFRNAKDVLVDDRKPLQALKSLFDKQELEETGEVEYGGSFPLSNITNIVEKNNQYADSELMLFVARANRSQYEDYESNGLLTRAELKLFYHIADRYRDLSRSFADV